jgi:hypothetical protein
MKLDITNLTMPEPEAVALLKSEVRRLRAALAALADQDATLSVQGGSVIVTMDATLTDEEREAGGLIAMHLDYAGRDHLAATLRGLLERLGGER